MSRQVITSPGSNPYCGPAALSVLTGKDVDFCEKECIKELGDLPVMGMFRGILLKVLRNLGYRTEVTTMYQVSKNPEFDYLIVFPKHFGTICEGNYIDNQNPFGAAVLPRRSIEAVYKVMKGT